MLLKVCICKNCVAAFWRECEERSPDAVQAGDCYFDEKGLMVFNAEYHLRRGYCCGNGCRHCPYLRPN